MIENFWTVENGSLVLYKRTGECKGCGQCCCTHEIIYCLEVGFKSGRREDAGDEKFDWTSREGWSMFLAQGVWWYIKIVSVEDRPSPCSRLTDDMKCKDWQDFDEFPVICRYWPFHPSNLEKFPGCGFSFERV